MKFTTPIKFLSITAASAIFSFVSCSTDDSPEPISTLEDNKAKVQTQTFTPQTDSLFYNIKENKKDLKINSLFSFAGNYYNLDITPTDSTNYTFAYFDSKETDINNISLAVLDTVQFKTAKTLTLKMINNSFPYTNVPNTWYTYNAKTGGDHALSPISGRYALLLKGKKVTKFSRDMDEVYVVNLNEIIQNDDPKTKAVIQFTVKTKNFTK